ncbi:hypothetical protein ACQKWADRAFT_35656 [Trichoderma austrokoningii]
MQSRAKQWSHTRALMLVIACPFDIGAKGQLIRACAIMGVGYYRVAGSPGDYQQASRYQFLLYCNPTWGSITTCSCSSQGPGRTANNSSPPAGLHTTGRGPTQFRLRQSQSEAVPLCRY